MSDDFSTAMPTTPGRYAFSCGELDDEIEELQIILQNGVLIVDCPDLGRTPLEHYHGNLIYPKWVKLS